MDLDGVKAYDITCYSDLSEFGKEMRKVKPRLIAADGAQALSYMTMAKVQGTPDRAMPLRLPKSGDAKSNEWSDVHFQMKRAVTELKALAPFVVMTAPAAVWTMPETEITYIAPDLPGRQTRESVGWYELVAYLQTTDLGKDKTERTLVVSRQPRGSKERPSIMTRQRFTHELTADIVLPTGHGGWAALMDALLQAEGTEKHAKG